MVVLARQLPDWPLDWSEANIARQDFDHLIGLLAASLLLDDEHILYEGLAWRRGYWAARGESSTSLRTRASALAAVLQSVSPEALGMLRAAEDTD